LIIVLYYKNFYYNKNVNVFADDNNKNIDKINNNNINVVKKYRK